MIRRTPHVRALDQRVPEPESRRPKGIRHRRIHAHIVPPKVLALRGQLQIEQSAHLAPHHQRQKLAVRDVLHHGAHDASRLLEQLLIGPVRIEACQLAGESIVLGHPDLMEREQAWLLATASIAAANALVGQRLALAHVLGAAAVAAVVHATVAERAHRVGGARRAGVDGRGVQKGGDLVGLLAPRERTVWTHGGRGAQELQAAQAERSEPRIVVGHGNGQAGGVLEVVVGLAVTATGNGAVDASV